MNAKMKIAVIGALALAVIATIVVKQQQRKGDQPPVASLSTTIPAASASGGTSEPVASATARLPRMVDLGADKCIPCKMMAPILDDLKTSYVDRLQVEFIDVWKFPDAKEPYNIKIIPTQIFFDAAGKELFRHEGFFSKEDILAKWKEFGLDLAGAAAPPDISRWKPAQPDTRAKETVCYLCDGDIAPKDLVVVKTDKGDVRLCGMHHYFVMYSCLTEDKAGFEKKVTVANWAGGGMVPVGDATYVWNNDGATKRPMVKAFAVKAAAEQDAKATAGTVLDFAALAARELTNTCGFCDRAVYPEDVAEVRVGDARTWGCCSHCALGVAARTGKDIEVRERDRWTGDPIVVKIVGGKVTALDPATAVAWFGQRVKTDGTHVSAGCFHQGFFVTPDTLWKWLAANPRETGEMIMIQKALADKMALTAQQIGKACKIGECSPK